MRYILWFAIILYTTLFSALSFWKYDQLLYNGLDLAIYANVFWNTAHGNWFASSIHPPSYLGDHFEPLILPLSLLYRIWSDPRTLLILQSLALALTAWPLYKIADVMFGHGVTSRRGDTGGGGLTARSASEHGEVPQGAGPRATERKLPLFISLLWLLNPFVHNANLFEFHMLIFAPLFLFWMYYFYLKRRFLPFLLFVLLSLAVREDVALLVAAFGILFLIEWSHSKRKIESQSAAVPPSGVADQSGHGPRPLSPFDIALSRCNSPSVIDTACPAGVVHRGRGSDGRQAVSDRAGGASEVRRDAAEWLYGAVAIISSILWLLLSFSIISHFAPEGSYKFLSYYSWISSSSLLEILAHFAKPTVLAMSAGILMPFLFLPLLRPRFLLLALPPFLQFALTSSGGGSVVLFTHYAIPFLPALFLATIAFLNDVVCRVDLPPSPPKMVADAATEESPSAGEGSPRAWLRLLRHSVLGGASPAEHGDLPRRGSVSAVGEAAERLHDKNSPFPPIITILLVTATLYTLLTMGPLLPALKKIFFTPTDQKLLQIKKEFLARIPKDTPIVATENFLPYLANRTVVAALRYVFLGQKERSRVPYELPKDIEMFLIDFDDFRTLWLQSTNNVHYEYGAGVYRIRTAITERALAPEITDGNITLFTKKGDTTKTDSVLQQMGIPPLRGGLELDGIRSLIRVIDR